MYYLVVSYIPWYLVAGTRCTVRDHEIRLPYVLAEFTTYSSMLWCLLVKQGKEIMACLHVSKS